MVQKDHFVPLPAYHHFIRNILYQIGGLNAALDSAVNAIRCRIEYSESLNDVFIVVSTGRTIRST